MAWHDDALNGGWAFVHVINRNFIGSDVKDRTASLVNSMLWVCKCGDGINAK